MAILIKALTIKHDSILVYKTVCFFHKHLIRYNVSTGLQYLRLIKNL